MTTKVRYAINGTIFFKPNQKCWAVQVQHYSGAGAPFKTIKWATWDNENRLLGMQETNEGIDMIGWRIATLADIALYSNSEISEKISLIKDLVNLGYKGEHQTPNELLKKLKNTYDYYD